MKKGMLFAMAAAMTVTPVVTSCQGKQDVTSTSLETPSYTEPHIQSGTIKESNKTTTTYETLTIEAVTEAATREYVASPNTIIENGEIVGTHVIPENVTTTTTTTTTTSQVQMNESTSNNAAPAETNKGTNVGANSTESNSNSTPTPTQNEKPSVSSIQENVSTPSTAENSENNAISNDIISDNSDEIQQPQQSNDNINFIPQVNRKPQSISIPESKIADIYTVISGDCLSTIGEKYGISAEEIALANTMSLNDIILPGDQLIIPNHDAVLDEILRDTTPSSKDTYYTVVENDSFYGIAEKFGITPENLAAYNGKSLEDFIYPGLVLKIPKEGYIKPEVSSAEDIPFVELSDETDYEEIPVVEDSPVTENISVTEDNSVTEDTSVTEDNSVTEDTPATEDSTTVDNTSVSEESPFVELSDETISDETTPIENVYTNYDVETAADILNTIKSFEAEFLGSTIAMGIYSLDGTPLFEYNTYSPISGACTVKAPYAMYVLKCCELEGIDIWSEKLQYQDGMRNDGSGNIKNDAIGSEYTIAYLLNQLLSISDNTAYNILVSRFSLDGYQVFLNSIGGQQLYGLQYGTVSVEQRKNEWLSIYQYINSGSYYSTTLQQMLSNTAYCYLVQGMNNYHNYMHKSGWCDGTSYTSASDCAIIDDQYLVIVLSQDYLTGTAHTDVVQVLGREAELFMS